ncbi:type IV secretory system conjugative DNA transfer family protein [Lutimaribacter sp. EGI FJ00015]|uniref:Type IV secretory system conjugative DNA transfer family protein n=1 Tax=Lutimaribacter degradans TaxID=2945989 RepID=A0ACC5ZTY3_9RHOB|nr:type IV secretory system conjugative DNA transfer family protein [Lutimaribacter sp. EGI FJ00013]MCM2561752.1 type IV secretory system conjugative DNA transfer family protein [Lutimaribacter sp. EGI FJ00013]MCO0613216.1 type IV secretory system conjugative DNA transfer family protein [Lutimaribacter sp. EGI FJ00015]MCO0635584.1 type IV secretory system conjugative DNA transfer family protein [Lutimaribacter sp. EGI FJ00014]
MHAQRPPNPFGRMFVGGLVAGGTGYLLGPLDALSDPVSAFALGLLFLAGLLSIAHGIFDGFRVLLLRAARRKAETPTGLYGDAAFADLRDCADFGLTDPNGLFLGTLDGVPLFAGGKAHLLTVAPARQGKGTSVVIPNLLHYSGSVFVTDPKGELAAITAQHREEAFDHKVIFLNPWNLHGLRCDRYNPLQPLIDMAADPRRHGELGDAVRANAFMLEPEPEGGDKNRYFRDGARNMLEGLQLHLATRGRPQRCTLPDLWRVIKSTDVLEMTLRDMAQSTALDGVVAAYGQELLHQFEEGSRQFDDFRNGASNALQVFRPGGPLADAVSGSDIEFRELKMKPTTVYVMIPAERIGDYGKWLALVARHAINATVIPQNNQPVLFLLDEFANMGKIAGFAEALTLLPGFGVRIWAIVQDLSHLAQVYGRETTNIILSQSEVKQFFAVQDMELAQRLSRLLGERSIITRNYNLGQRDEHEVGVSVSERGVPLMLPQEIMALPDDRQLLFVKAAPPVLASKARYWDVFPWRDWADPNPMEGDHPRGGKPVFRLRYAKTRSES